MFDNSHKNNLKFKSLAISGWFKTSFKWQETNILFIKLKRLWVIDCIVILFLEVGLQ